MPLSTEMVNNKPLSGMELREILIKELDDLLEHDGMFRSHVGYGKVSYKVTVDLKLNNPTYPEHSVKGQEKSLGKDEGDGEVQKVTKSRSREVLSPNVARIANGLPIKTQVKHEGKVVEKELHYSDKIPVTQPEAKDETIIA